MSQGDKPMSPPQTPITHGPGSGPPGPSPNPPSPEPNCWQGRCLATRENIRKTFPALRAAPRPEPESRNTTDHSAWEKEYNTWGSLRCGCGNGYFCREHGDWISGEEVSAGTAVDGKSQSRGRCPRSHYQDSGDRSSYVGKRDHSFV